MAKPKIAIIISTTRATRFGEKAAKWIHGIAAARTDMSVELIDLREYPMPFFDEPASNMWVPSKNEVAQRWQKKVAEFDGYIFVTAEYNRGVPAVLKNALDYAYPEWNRKAAGFVSYGSAMGARGVQQLRQTAIEPQLAPVRSSVHIPVATLWAHYQGGDVDAGLAELEAPAGAMIDDLLWWTAALKTARGNAS